MSVAVNVEGAHVDALREFITDQVRPLAQLHAELVRRWLPRLDVEGGAHAPLPVAVEAAVAGD